MGVSGSPAIAAERLSDLDLVGRARKGDADAFGLLINARLGTLLRTAMAILRNEDDAAEAVQDTLVSAWKHLPSLRDLESFDAWITRVLVNRCRDRLRRRQRSREIVLEASELEIAASTDSASITDIREAFDRISVEHRHILLLHHLHDMPLTEIARLLAIPVGTAKSRLWTARRALERALEAQS